MPTTPETVASATDAALVFFERVGFPSWVAVYLLVKVERRLQALTDAIYQVSGMERPRRKGV